MHNRRARASFAASCRTTASRRRHSPSCGCVNASSSSFPRQVSSTTPPCAASAISTCGPLPFRASRCAAGVPPISRVSWFMSIPDAARPPIRSAALPPLSRQSTSSCSSSARADSKTSALPLRLATTSGAAWVPLSLPLPASAPASPGYSEARSGASMSKRRSSVVPARPSTRTRFGPEDNASPWAFTLPSASSITPPARTG